MLKARAMLKSSIPALQGRIARNARRGAQSLAGAVAEQIVATVPVSDDDSPGHVHTRDTVEVKETKDGAEVSVGGAILFIEYGTVNQAAQPVVRPAFERGRARVREYFGDVTK